MKRCRTCNAENPDSVETCFSCGARLGDDTRDVERDVLPSGTSLMGGRYTVGRVIAQGGFGITYLGSDTTNQTPVAIKELFLQGCRREGTTLRTTRQLSQQDFDAVKKKFLTEGNLVSKFSHPGIVHIHSVFEENGTAYIVMEYLEGKTLRDIVSRRGAIDEPEAVSYAMKIADALTVIHNAKFIHRDIKPDNVIVTDTGRVVLIDFGTAREYAANQTKSMTSWLTPGYAPIEQYSHKGHFSASTDLYALGATLYHLLTGRMPEQATDRVTSDNLVPPNEMNPSVSRTTSDAIMWAMDMDAGKRPQTVAQFVNALNPGSTQTVWVPPVSSHTPQPLTGSLNSRMTVPVVLILLAVVVIITAFVVGPILKGRTPLTDDDGPDDLTPIADADGISEEDSDGTNTHDNLNRAQWPSDPEPEPVVEPDPDPAYIPPRSEPVYYITEQDILNLLNKWSGAQSTWNSLRNDAYIDYTECYLQSDFLGIKTTSSGSRTSYNWSEWLDNRVPMYDRTACLIVTYSDVEFYLNPDSHEASARFTQTYRSDRYADQGHKFMRFRMTSSGLKITYEEMEDSHSISSDPC